ncbi:MAG TPA: PadR family transcriptional regulator, partial [Glaciibacter sp.]|nr:PadR family transcriptional regulator [Glaciibacter sp.]
MTPVFAHGSLRLYLLSLLAEQPRHGYELIQALSDRFGGTYSPSAGTIYPRLAKLEEEGLVTKAADGRKTVYEITDAGRAELADRESDLNAIENDMTDSVRRLADEVRAGVNGAMKSLRADLASAARQAKEESQRQGTTSNLHVDSNRALHEADIVLNEFRQQLRTDL